MAVFVHNIYDMAILGHDLAVSTAISWWDGQQGLSKYMANNPNIFTPEAADAVNAYMKNNPLVPKEGWKMDFSKLFEQNSGLFSDEMKHKLHEYTDGHTSLIRLTASKLGGFLGNKAVGKVMGSKEQPGDSWGAYFSRKIIPGALYCALFSASYGTVPLALTSFIVTTAITDAIYKVVGEKLLGLSHIKS